MGELVPEPYTILRCAWCNVKFRCVLEKEPERNWCSLACKEQLEKNAS